MQKRDKRKPTRRCPVCSQARTLDWYGEERRYDDRCDLCNVLRDKINVPKK